jgi:hypothetical protein
MQVPSIFANPKFNQMIDPIIKLLDNDIVKTFAGAAIGAAAKTFGDKFATQINGFVDWFMGSLKSGGMAIVKSAVGQAISKKIGDAATKVNNYIGKYFKAAKPENDDAAKNEQKAASIFGRLQSAFSAGLGELNKAFGKIIPGQQPQQQPAADQNAQTQPQQQAAPQQAPAPAPAPAPAAQPAQTGAPAQPGVGMVAQASAPTEEIKDGELSMFESVFGKVDEEKPDDITDLLSMI